MSGREYDEALQRVKDEILCDAYAVINAFGAHAEKFQEQTQRVMQRRGIGRKPKENAAALARRGAGDDREQFSIQEVVGKKKDYGKGVLLDTNLFDGVKPREWGRKLNEYVYNMAGQAITAYDADGNEETIYLARKNDRVTKDGATNGHKVLDKLARYRGDNLRSVAIVHLAEALKVSEVSASSPEHSHPKDRIRAKRSVGAYLDIRRPYMAGNVHALTNDIADYTSAEPGEDWDYDGYTPEEIAMDRLASSPDRSISRSPERGRQFIGAVLSVIA